MRYLLTLSLVLVVAQGCGSSRSADDTRASEPAVATAPGDTTPAPGARGPAMAPRNGPGMRSGRMGQGMGPGGMGPGMDGDMTTIHSLLADHAAIERRVEDRTDGVETWTESDDPEVAEQIRQHVRDMYARLEEGRPMRRWDPLFDAIFARADAIEMTIEDTPRGVRVVETSDDPEVVALIRQHAHRAVSEFVERGMDRAHEPTPLPEDY